jgi:ABC-2 type transport system permease protein
MNLFLREMNANRKSLIIWCIGILFMVISGMSKFEAYSSSTGPSVKELFSKMPKSLQAIIGVQSLDISTAIGFYGMLFSYLLLMAAIHALTIGAAIIAKEERDKTSEFLMAKPISRTQIITAKLAAVLVNVLIFNIVTLILSVSMVHHFNKANEPIQDVYILMAGMLLLQLFFAALGAGIAAVSKKPKRATSLGTAILLLMYILSIGIDISSKISGLKYITPFKYYEAKTVMADGALNPVYVVLSVILVVIFLSVTYLSFKKRDLNV